MVKSRDVQEIVAKLSSDKAKTREEGIKLLNTWLEGERSNDFCKYLAQKTAKLKPAEIPHSETWPFFITMLIQCASLEISPSKRRSPKLVFAKTLRIVVQRAEDDKFSGNLLPLLPVVKSLFNHIWEVLNNDPSYQLQSEYGLILQDLLVVRDYRFHMRKRIYCSLVLLYMENMEKILSGRNDNQHIIKDVNTLRSLLENPPGDFPENLRDGVVRGFVRIFSCIRDEGKVSRKLIECINTFLLKDGPNLGRQSLEIHNAVHQFVFRCLLTTHDQTFKDCLIFYAMLQLNMTRGATDGSFLVQHLLDIVYKELDQSSVSNTIVPRTDAAKYEKFGTLSSSHCALVELAAAVLYRACINLTKAPSTEKRVKREHVAAHLREALMKGKWLWYASFCCLTRKYSTRIGKDLFMYWFEGICTSFQRILNEANVGHAYDGLLWTLRSLQELSSVLLLPDPKRKKPLSSSPLNEFDCGWQLVWSCLMQGFPLFSNVTAVVDAALVLLGNIISSDLVHTCVVPQDVWDLRIFKQMPSVSLLYFISCYFSRKGSQGDVRDILHLRKNLLRAVLGQLKEMESSIHNKQLVLLLPAAVNALCAGCVPFTQCHTGLIQSYTSLDATDAVNKTEKPEHNCLHGLFDCTVEVLADIGPGPSVEVFPSQHYPNLRLPRQLREPLLSEMETLILGALVEKEMRRRSLSDIFFKCAILSNIIYGSVLTRQREEVSSFVSKLGRYLLELLDFAVTVTQGNDCLALSSDLLSNGASSIVASFRSFAHSPIFSRQHDQNHVDAELYGAIMQVMERLLKAMSNVYEEFSSGAGERLTACDTLKQYSFPADSNKSRIVDMELDVNEDTGDMDTLSDGGKTASGVFSSVKKWKLGMISLISNFFSVLHTTWDVLFKLLSKERDQMVREKIMFSLCQHPFWSSAENFKEMVGLMTKMIKIQVSLKLDCGKVLSAIHGLLGTLSSLDTNWKDKGFTDSLGERGPEQNLMHLRDAVAECDLLDWFGRVKLIDCICNFVLLSPQIGQTLIERLLTMLQDPDYRVRFSLARRIGVLFQMWDGHEELFNDICSNFGVKLVVSSKEKLVTASEVLASGPQPQPTMETVIITLMHLALQSEKIELEAVFMICVVAAIDPCQRELIFVILDNLSRQLRYASRFKYLEELLGSILFSWVACGVSLAALVEIRQLFVSDSEPSYFMQYCCHWLLPALVLHGDSSSLSWVARIACQPPAVLVKNHFVQIFSVCMGLHCSKRSGWEKGADVLQNSILHLAQISENERDKLIKKHMVSIVSHILSLASSAPNPTVPFFSRDTIVRGIQTIVDGFLEMEDYATSVCVVDKINIFRPDRVFMFIVELHYRIAAATHHRHTCHRLAGIEVLIDVLGHRAAMASTSNYLFNLIGQFIGYHDLQDQCCRVISVLLKTFKSNPSREIISVLGEQLQFLVSKLVACCIPSETKGEQFGCGSSQVLSLLFQLTVHSDPSLYDYIRELEPFPEIDIFDEIRKFHQDLCRAYSPRDHLLKFVRRSGHLPPRLLLWSLQALHKKLLLGETFQIEKNAADRVEDRYWHCDDEIMTAVWTMVRMCGSEDANSIRVLVSDFISRVGIGDPHCVVFHLPGNSSNIHVCQPVNQGFSTEGTFPIDTGLSEELLVALLKLLKKYLMDDSVKIVDMTSQALRGILSTQRGQNTLLSFDSYERSLIEVHSKGVNIELVEKLLLDLEIKFKAEAIPIENSTVWVTHGKTFDEWICPLVCSLIGLCSDVILRLCQDIVLMKAEVAELLLASIIVNLAGKKDMDVNLYKLISLQVQEHVFTDSNKLIKSIQVWLNALNELRLCHVMERSSLLPLKQESSKSAKPSSYSSKSRSTSVKARESASMYGAMAMSTPLWDKVYWLSIDYLVVAKSAVVCGSYFTAMMYVEHWCEEHFNILTLGSPDFSHFEMLPRHIEILVAAATQINEPDSLYGIIQSHKLTSQIITFEHEGDWSKALEYYDLQVRSAALVPMDFGSRSLSLEQTQPDNFSNSTPDDPMRQRKPYKGLIRSLQQTGCMHVLDFYCQGLTSRKGQFHHDLEFTELQYEAAWRAANWDFSLLYAGDNSISSTLHIKANHFNENLHSCLRALKKGNFNEFHEKLKDSKQELVWSVSRASEESTEHIYSAIIKLQILYHLGKAWDLRWRSFPSECMNFHPQMEEVNSEPLIPTVDQLSWLSVDWSSILERTQLHMSLLEPFIAFRRVLLQVLNCKDSMVQHLLQSTCTLRKGSRFSQAAAALHEFKFLCVESGEQQSSLYWLGRLEEAKLLRSQGQHEMAISLAKYVAEYSLSNEESSDVHRLVGKWLAETRSSSSRTILEKYLKPAVSLVEDQKATDKRSRDRQSQTHFHLAHYADALFRSYEERLSSSEWQAAMRLRKHKTTELEALIRRLKCSTKGEKTDYSIKIQELQKQLAMDKEEAEKLQDDRDNFLSLALDGYKHCLVVGDKYDVRVVFRLVSLWFSLSSRKSVVDSMLTTITEVQSYKFIPLVYQIASRMGSLKDSQGSHNFQFALVSLVKKMAIDHPYHTIFQLLALANGDRIKDKQRSKNSFVVDMDKKLAAENLLRELTSYHGSIINQMKQMVEIYIKLAELETKREDTNRKLLLPRELRNLKQLELVPVVTATFPIDQSCQYDEGSFPYFKGLAESVTVMNGINAPKVVECLGSDGCRYRQLAKSGNDDLRQDAVMEQFFALVNTFLRNHRDTWKRRLGVRTYKVVPFTPSAGVLEWVNGTLPLGEYLIGSMRNGGAHGRYGIGDWSFLKCREHMANGKDKRKAFQEVCGKFRPVMHHFFLERFLQPADWFEKRLAYTRSVAASSMVGYIVGLGDRHAMNILIDQTTAEVVHIDLGVAFEQGLMLKTPERVPFRLTRDIIDGMGVTGIEGVFRRCCEETLSVMRTNKEALLTIVEVFIHDPLYKWALSPLKALQRQKEMDYESDTSLGDSEDEYEGNKDAARALMRVKQKLDGYEEGEMRSIHGQVQQLIQDAIDPERLCQLFPGWGAWL
ncbi:putative non-specific serine/threonine protein kinase [Rosa chinensis]|uniref:Serine/threonine-protein kinase ATM n=1 Tax=Rosa chinensis TaxID=74649 RepID=A0A2P6PQX9_ROSCH|nr:serine/threonine-protein kinase ATM isoform X2 [Rosa chinensis]PRQ24322.1 putative non-specific serine/threonine protein kinase [Rosa chinensis]